MRRARRTVSLPPDAGSPARARRILRATLHEAGRLDCLDAAELACTELVTNAVLHAHSTVVLTVEVATDVRVEVRDSSASMPSRRHHDPQATTGRGLALVAALTDDYGVSDAGPEGKTVWFTVGGEPHERREDELLAAWTTAWGLDDEPPTQPPPTAGHRVRLVDLPSALWLAARQHHDALLRELALYRVRSDERHDVAVDLAGTDRARTLLSEAVAAAVEQQRRAVGARESGLEPGGEPGAVPGTTTLPWSPQPVDLELVVPAEMGPDFAAMQDTLDRAERLARDGHLLARPGLPEIIAVRDWACEQVVAQLAGIVPAPWPGTDTERPDGSSFRREDLTRPEGFDLDAVTAAPGCRVAADESNRILAVSRPLARLLGWQPEELVGRRIVAIIPPRLREAHVAGFTRHLTTGEVHVLGVPLTVPVLRADGTEITCGLLIEHVALPAGRTAYLATLQPPGHG